MMDKVLEILNYIFTAIFALEMLLKLVGMGPYGYIKDPFNLFDGFIVIMRWVLMPQTQHRAVSQTWFRLTCMQLLLGSSRET